MVIILHICLDNVYSQQELFKALEYTFSLQENEIIITDNTWTLPPLSEAICVIGETSFVKDFPFCFRINLYLRNPRLQTRDELEVAQTLCAILQCHGILPDNRPGWVLNPTAWLLLDGKTMKERSVAYEDLEKIDEAEPYKTC